MAMPEEKPRVADEANRADAGVQGDEGFSLDRRAASFGFAFSGLGHMLRTQHNAWIHLVFTVAVIGVGVLLQLSRLDWSALVLAMGLVWAAEALNTALESLADAVSPQEHPLVGRAKDAAAGAVLVCAIAAAAVGFLVLGPPLLGWLGF